MKTRSAAARMFAISMLFALAASATAQQAYPNRSIRVINPYPPGGTTDILARLVGQKLTESWGQQVIVDNRPGGNTVIGTEAMVKSAPDGYTLLSILTSHVIVPTVSPTPYDPVKDFAAVATIAGTELAMVMHPSVPANTLQEWITLAKARPGQLNYASGGSGTATHIVGEFFNILTGIKTQHVPYKGSAQVLPAVISNQVQLFFSPPVVAMPHIKSGKLKAIAISGESRLAALPQVPTVSESGIQGFDVKVWYGLLAPAATPKGVIDKLSAEVGRILSMPDIKEKLDSQGLDPLISSPEQFGALLRTDLAKYAKVIKAANIKVED